MDQATEDVLALVSKEPSGASYAAGTSSNDVISQGSSILALAVTVFGRAVLCLPLQGRISHLQYEVALDYRAYPDSIAIPNSKYTGGKLTKESAQAKFGLLSPQDLMNEIGMDRTEFEAKVEATDDVTLTKEIAALKEWHSHATHRLSMLECRAAWAVLGLQEGSTGPAELRQAFKKRALQLHPDKGGNQIRFQLLQEMKGILIQHGCMSNHNSSRDNQRDSDSEAEFVSSAGTIDSAAKVAHDKIEDAGDESPSFNRHQAEASRKKLHDTAVEFCHRCSRLCAEIEEVPANLSSNVHICDLNERIEQFMAGITDREQGATLDKFEQFVDQSSELLGIVSVLDPCAAVKTVAMRLTGPLVAAEPSLELQRQCMALLEAIQHMPRVLHNIITSALVERTCSPHQKLDTSSVAETPASSPLEEQLAVEGDAQVCNGPSEGLGQWSVFDVHPCAGQRREDGSAVYCTACDCWVPATLPFRFADFLGHCNTDFMHNIAVETLG